MIIFYRIFVSRNQRTYKESTVKRIVFLYWPLLILWLPAFVTSVVGQTISSKNTAALTTTSDGIAVCKVVPAYLYFIFSYAMALVVVAWALYYRMRHIPEAFNEFRLSFWMLSIFTMLLTFNITMLALNYMALAWTRITLAVCNTLFLNAYMWQVLGPPIYGHIFHRQETLCRIIDLIHQESLSARHMNAGKGYKELYGFNDTDSITHGDDKSTHRGNSESKYIGSVMDIAYYPHIEGMSDSDFSITAGNKGPRQII
ncbi:hypothetical protein EC988_006926 [Linderina pennispora]|nr:hypothetical protein EC988_006926 [Linderina pennispora]